MTTNIGEYIAGAYLKLCDDEIDFIDYNVRIPNDQYELDILGLNIQNKVAHLCEVATHTKGGLDYRSGNKSTVQKIKEKHSNQKEYAEKYLKNFECIRYSLWSPKVYGKVTKGLKKIEDLELVINQEYGNRVKELKELAKYTTSPTGNPYFRMLQIEQNIRN